MVNPGAFQGLRKTFLMGEKVTFSAAVEGGYTKDAIANIQRRFFKRFPLDLPQDEEPTPEHLAAVDDESPDDEPEQPDEQAMDAEQYSTALKNLEERQKLLQSRKGQIKRWLTYQYMKDNNFDPAEPGANNPYRVLLHKLTGIAIMKPRCKPAANLWRKVQRGEIKTEVQKRAKAKGMDPRKLAPLREAVIKELFAAILKDEQDDWTRLAKEQHDEAVKKWKTDISSPPSTDPKERQRCIQGLTSFAMPILDLICEATGWKATLIVGGPEPAHGGRLNIISMHSGTTSSDIKMNFGRAEIDQYTKFFVPTYGDFLRKCYTPEECRARALPDDEDGFVKIMDIDFEDNAVNVDSVPLQSDKQTLTAQLSRFQSTLSQDSEDRMTASNSSTCEDQLQSVRSPSRLYLIHSPPLSQPPSRQPSIPRSLSPFSFRSPNREQTPGEQLPKISEPINFAVNSPSAMDNGSSVLERPSSGGDQELLPPTSTSPAPRHSHRQRFKADAPSIHPPAPNNDLQRQNAPLSATAAMDRLPSLVPSKRRKTRGHIEEQPAKKVRTNAASSNEDAPPWFTQSKSLFYSESLGDEWLQLLDAWERFELQEGYKEQGKVSSKGRPEEVQMWISRARPTIWRPSIKDPKIYAAKFNSWWVHLQPQWRVSKLGTLNSQLLEGNWDCLRKPGLNGLQSVIVALFYWGIAAQKGVAHRAWVSAVLECHRVFLCLLHQ